MSKRRRERPADYLKDWVQRQALAEAMVPIVGKLFRSNVRINVYGRSLVNQSPMAIMKSHRFVRQIEDNELSEFESFPILQAIAELNLKSSDIDLGRLSVAYMSLNKKPDHGGWLKQELAEALNGTSQSESETPRDVVIFGFGRIGRLLTRIMVYESGNYLRLRAIAVRQKGAQDLVKRASLLRRDSVHGSFRGTIRVDEELNALIINGHPIRFIDAAEGPASIDYLQYGIEDALLIDSTGAWRDRESLAQHLSAPGISKVLLTAPGEDDLKNIVYGINESLIEPDDEIVSAASCTTNAIVPVLKLINDEYGIEFGHIETVHAYTNDQNLIDNYHAKSRRGRSAAMNMVITETGAASAISKALPELSGRITGNAIRVPTPNVSLAILNLRLGKNSDVQTVNEFLRSMSLHSKYRAIVDYTASPEVVSSDFVGSTSACIVDSQATIVQDNQCMIYLWYDNEYGYCWQLFRLAKEVLGVKALSLPVLAK